MYYHKNWILTLKSFEVIVVSLRAKITLSVNLFSTVNRTFPHTNLQWHYKEIFDLAVIFIKNNSFPIEEVLDLKIEISLYFKHSFFPFIFLRNIFTVILSRNVLVSTLYIVKIKGVINLLRRELELYYTFFQRELNS